jgi:hypothetical protein
MRQFHWRSGPKISIAPGRRPNKQQAKDAECKEPVSAPR